jgi:hypothetical protein
MNIQKTQSQPSFKALVIKKKLAPETIKKILKISGNEDFKVFRGQTFLGGYRLCINTKLGTKEESLLKMSINKILGSKNPIVTATAEAARKLVKRYSFTNCKPLPESLDTIFR